jgi:dTDP-3-amino-3,4,6-trideoxy-alpha-D-glucose transaminase
VPPRVPFFDMSAAFEEVGPQVISRMEAVLASGRYILGPECDAFEQEFADFIGVAGCVGVGNGLDALRLCLTALGIGAGDDVLVPSNTFIATWLAVSAVGARPVPVEPDEATFNISAAAIASAVTPRTRAVIPVHLYGLPADMPGIVEYARAHDLRVIEDACQAHGARDRGQRAGSFGDLAAWSFYPAKNLGAYGDGGAVTGSDRALVERVRLLANYGSPRKYEHMEKGFNSRLDELQAAVLRVKLRCLDEWNARRVEVAERYLDGIRHPEIRLPGVPPTAQSVWHQFVVRSPKRDLLSEHLRREGIETLIHYPAPPHLQGAYEEFADLPLPIAERLSNEVLSLPMGPHLTQSQVDIVTAALNSFDVA